MYSLQIAVWLQQLTNVSGSRDGPQSVRCESSHIAGYNYAPTARRIKQLKYSWPPASAAPAVRCCQDRRTRQTHMKDARRYLTTER